MHNCGSFHHDNIINNKKKTAGYEKWRLEISCINNKTEP